MCYVWLGTEFPLGINKSILILILHLSYLRSLHVRHTLSQASSCCNNSKKKKRLLSSHIASYIHILIIFWDKHVKDIFLHTSILIVLAHLTELQQQQ